MRECSRRWSYTVVAALLSVGSVLGLLLLRTLSTEYAPDVAWLRSEWRALWPVYVYLAVSSGLVFGTSGWWAGRAHDRLKILALTDPLTGLWNRRYFERRVREELIRAARYEAPLSLLMVDVDRLKVINDRHGHKAGDEALRQIAEVLRSTVRGSDVAARYGGDEFAILAPATTVDAAARLAERICNSLHSRRPGLSVSVGVAGTDQSAGYSLDTLRDAADAALYRAKAAGCGRVASVTAAPGEDSGSFSAPPLAGGPSDGSRDLPDERGARP